MNPSEVAAYEEVSNYLGDHANQLESSTTWIRGPSTLSHEAQTAFTIVLQRFTVELKLANIKLKQPVGKMCREVVTYLALIQVCTPTGITIWVISSLFFTQNIVDTMAGSENWKEAAKDYNLDKLHTDITKIIADF